MHLPQSGVRLAMHRLTVDIVTIDITLQQQHRYVARRAQVDKLLDWMFDKSLVEQRKEQPLAQCCRCKDINITNNNYDNNISDIQRQIMA